MKVNSDSMKLYAVTDSHHLNGRRLEEVVDDVLKGGATFLQLREKDMSHDELVKEAVIIKKIADRYNVPFVIDDDIYAAKEADADGVHIGQSDADYQTARKLLGPDKIIGMTAPSVELAKKAESMAADYIGAGAVFNTSTKKDTHPLSTDALKEIADSVSIPVVAIGGINKDNINKLRGTDIDGVAVVSALFSSNDPQSAARSLLEISKSLFNDTIK